MFGPYLAYSDRIQLVLFGMRNMIFSPYLAAINRIIISHGISSVVGFKNCACTFNDAASGSLHPLKIKQVFSSEAVVLVW
jgi:hypothetical protein